MPTREEMIAEMAAGSVQPSREEMIAEMSAAQQPQEEVVLNEQYEPIQGVDRALIKNTKGDNQGIMNYLHEKHKNSEFRMEGDSVQGRDRGTKEWRKMDVDSSVFSPSTWELQDLSDVGTDIAGGVAEGAAALAAGTAGMVGTPLGAIAAGSAAAGATATGVDLVKQGAAKFLGLREEEIDGVDALKEGAISAATTPLFGIGGTGKIAKKVAGMGLEGVEKAAALKLAQRAEEGLIISSLKGAAKGTKSGGMGIAAMTSGVEKKHFQNYFRDFDELENLTSEGAMGMSDELFSQFTDAAQRKVDIASDAYESLKGTGRTTDISDTLGDFVSRRDRVLREVQDKYRSRPDIFRGIKEELDVLEKSIFGDITNLSSVELENVMDMEKMVKDFRVPDVTKGSSLDTATGRYVNDLLGNLSEGLTKNLDTAARGNSIPKYSTLKANYKKAIDTQSSLEKLTKDEAAMYGMVLGINTKAAQKSYKINRIKNLATEFNLPFDNVAEKLTAYTKLKNPHWMPESGTATSTSRSLFGGGVGGVLGFALGGGNPMTAAAGAAAGSIMGSPASMKGIGKVGRSVGNNLQGLGRKVPQLDPRLGNVGQRAVWQSINNRDR